MGKFTKWIYDTGGTRLASIKIDVSQSAVQHWIARRRIPNKTIRKKIIRIAKGKLNERDILQDTQP